MLFCFRTYLSVFFFPSLSSLFSLFQVKILGPSAGHLFLDIGPSFNDKRSMSFERTSKDDPYLHFLWIDFFQGFVSIERDQWSNFKSNRTKYLAITYIHKRCVFAFHTLRHIAQKLLVLTFLLNLVNFGLEPFDLILLLNELNTLQDSLSAS